MNQTQTRSLRKKVLSLILAVVMLVSLLPISAFASGDSKASTTDTTSDGYEYNIMFLDCGRKYYSVDSIKQIIDNASAAGFNYIQLAVGNDGLRFLLDDMSLTVNGVTYSTAEVTKAIQNGNTAYNKTFDNRETEDTKATCKYNPEKNELTQSEMDTIIAYAATKGMGVIPCVNTPGHMDAILSAASSLTGTTCSYNGSVRTIDVTNNTAVAFTQALLQKYINYFAGKGCQLFNMGADEYANDIYDSGSMGFGNLQSSKNYKYNYYVDYVNAVAKLIKDAKMTPMAFNDGIYFNNDTKGGTFDTDIIICYWSSGWSSYKPMPASELADKGFKLINTNGDYYWVLGKTAKCSAAKAGGFDKTAFPGSTVSNPVGSMFCIWADYPGAETEESVISKTAATIAAFGKTLPEVGIKSSGGTALTLNGSTELTVPGNAEATWTVDPAGVIELQSSSNADDKSAITGTSVIAKAVGVGTAKVTATVDGKTTYTTTLTVTDPSTVNVTVAVNGTKTITVDGNVSGTLDNEIAKATTAPTTASEKKLELVTAIESGEQYLIVHQRSGLVLNDAQSDSGLLLNGKKDTSDQLWTITKAGTSNNTYTVKGVNESFITGIGSGTATLGTNSSNLYLTYNNSGYWDICFAYYNYWGELNYYYLNQYGGTDSTTAAGYTENGATDKGSRWEIYKVTPETKAQTTITFTGKSVGDTSIKIGDVTYKIHVVAEGPSKVTPLTIEYWITNRQVTADNATSKTVNATDNSIYSEAGVKLSELVPSEGVGEEANSKTVFWKGTRLTTEVGKQNTDKGNDKTTVGDDFTYIRYWESKWAFSADGTKWTAFNSDDQVVAYYLQKTDVTNEVETQVVDWGAKRENYSYSTWVLLDYAVKYESGDRTPDTFPVDNKTLAFHCNYESTEDLGNTVIKDGSTYYRKIGAIRAEESDDYEVYMITVTPTSDTKTTQISTWASANKVNSYEYKGTEKVVWVDDAANLGAFADKELQYEGFHVGGNATVPGLQIYNRQGMLVTYYVRAKVKTDSLHVHYIDRSANNTEFYNYDIVVGANTSFDAGIGLNQKNWKGPLINGTVTNSLNKQQTVSADLSTMPRIGAQYRYAKYDCVEVTRSENGKDVYLYYTFNNTVSFVIDFGLPLQIPLNSLSTDLNNAVIEKVTISSQGRFGTAAYDETKRVITYTPTKTVDETDTLGISIKGTLTYKDDNGKVVTQNATVTYNVYVIPATSVYYEDSFATFTNADGTKNVAQVDNAGKGIWTKVTDGTTQTNVNQALEELGGTTNTKNVYGYDPAYANSSKFSMGSATKVTVDANTADNAQWPTATFTFKGTGFDVISLTDNTSGAIFVDVYKGTATSGDSVKSYAVNNYYSYKQNENGQWVVSKDGNNALYQIPVMKVSGLDYGEYTAVIRVAYSSFFDQTTKNEYNFWLDAIRVYDPMGKDNATYEQDNEGYPQYIKLHDELVKTGSSIDAKPDTTVFIDGADKATIDQYKNGGPNNEVYLANGQAITFKIPANANIASIQIGAKAPNGTAKMTVTGTDDPKEISSATEMYYKVNVDATAADKVVTIANKGTGILSLTNLKITFKTNPNATVTLAALTDDDQANAVAQVRALFAAPAEPFNPDLFTASWGHSVRKGDTATLTVKTSEDVEAIEVDGQMIDKYVTRTERSGWGWWAKTVTFREFTYTDTATVTKDYTVCAVNGKGVSSDAITATLTVRPSVRDWLHGIFGKWF